ncbi:acetyl-CoA carboxylase biotin carboxyl carrier protein [Pleomorphomonas diazotrophica]|uniref:Biotin carboxyl carrier protein of acetyl-CoA carboxylase n=1 Tax=Pleomorphomonas diazotrophica TaxID=1166257 RepID=A0A1I4Q319_9HYPH|nr:acetyl-CoA carboxylase biotin carboxyl carrier protein [Pleomorphomonas diazotrophica]PKR90974.1 acetyl-CoA carboxylase biotin carboxyl carrier protein [Pleomorphomonas diazotrophica]SFM34424.1 acetyl-CoA carboxylase biotin carboxyl carrier protein [Pleomorphomonas diazotrophica]
MPQTFDYELIRQLANILDETNLTEIEVEQEKLKIRVARTAAPVTITQGGGGWAAPSAMPAMAAPAPVAAPAAEAPKAADPAANPGAVPSPMVGTAYVAPEPGARSFVEVGDMVKEGQTVMIIEAMKHLNHIPAPRAGRVTAVLVENGQPVEFGEPLLIIE